MNETVTVVSVRAAERCAQTAEKWRSRTRSAAPYAAVAGAVAGGVFGSVWDATVLAPMFAVLVVVAALVAHTAMEMEVCPHFADAAWWVRDRATPAQAAVAAIADEFDTVNWAALPDTLRDEAHTALSCAVQAADWLAWYDQHPARDFTAEADAARCAVDNLTAVRDSVRAAADFAAGGPHTAADSLTAAERKEYADSIARRPALETVIAEQSARASELAKTAADVFTRR